MKLLIVPEVLSPLKLLESRSPSKQLPLPFLLVVLECLLLALLRLIHFAFSCVQAKQQQLY